MLNAIQIKILYCFISILGGDEVWHLGSGVRSQDRLERGESKGDLYLKHYSFIIDYVLRKFPGKFNKNYNYIQKREAVSL